MEYFNNYFEYDESSPSGLRNKITRNSKSKIGMPSGTKNNTGHYQIMLHRVRYQAHRIIFEMFNGEIADGFLVDHIDGDRGNNKISNLRLASHRENTVNSKKKKGLSMLPKGITESTPGYFVAQVKYGKLYKRRSSRNLQYLYDWLKETRLAMHGSFANHG